MDIQGKWQPDKATGTSLLLIICCEATLYGMGFALKNKSNSRDAVRRWLIYMRSIGRETVKIRTDAASEVTLDFLHDINRQLEVKDQLEILLPFERHQQPSERGVSYDKAAPEGYAKHLRSIGRQ